MARRHGSGSASSTHEADNDSELSPAMARLRIVSNATLDNLINQRDKAEAEMNLLKQEWENAKDEKTKNLRRKDFEDEKANYYKRNDDVAEYLKSQQAAHLTQLQAAQQAEQQAAQLAQLQAALLAQQQAAQQAQHQAAQLVQLRAELLAQQQATLAQPNSDTISTAGLTNFWRAMQTNTDHMIPNVTIDLGTNILGQEDAGHKIFIRQPYLDLLEEVLTTLHNRRHFVLLGTPGIGKTFFGYFLLLHFVRDGRTVVYYHGRTKFSYLFSKDKVDCRLGEGAHVRYRNDPNAIYMVDSARPLEMTNARVVLITSPDKNVWQKFYFAAKHASRCFMPVWSLDELRCLRTALFAGVSEDIMLSLYNKWGGVPRFVLENATNKIYESALEGAITAANCDLLHIIKDVINSSGPETDVSHRLIHLTVRNSDYTEHIFTFASTYVAEQLLEKISRLARQDLIDFVRDARDKGYYSSLRGDALEWLAHRQLAEGGSFRIRRLVTSREPPAPVESIELPKRELHSFASKVDFDKCTVDAYFVPQQSNFASVDAICRNDTLFQMTVADKHPCKHAGLFHALENLLGTPAKPRLYFVVPEDKFADWIHAQPYIGDDKKVIKNLRNSVKKVEQYALEYKLPVSAI